jgi:hypothetical protein
MNSSRPPRVAVPLTPMETEEKTIVEDGIANVLNRIDGEMCLIAEIMPSNTIMQVSVYQKPDGSVQVCVYNPETDGQTYFVLGVAGSQFIPLDHG